MTFSKNRIKTLLKKKNKLQSRKKIKKKKGPNKKKYHSNSFRRKKINIRQKSIKHIKSKNHIAKKKRKAYIKKGGAKDDSNDYNIKFTKLLTTFLNKEFSSEGLDEEENKYYNFNFLLKQEEQKQEIIDPIKEEKEWDEQAMTEKEKEEKEFQEKTIQQDISIHGPTREFIEDGKKVCKSRIYMVNTGTSSPVILSEECDPEVSTSEWFEQIFNAI